MSNASDLQQLEVLEKKLDIESPAPHRDNAETRLISYSHMFRDKGKALQFAKNIKLGHGESLTGGCTEDSIGRLWWIGVQLDTIEQWRANGGFHRVAMRDPEIPKSEML